LKNLTNDEKDILIEIANIGAGNASKALGELSGHYIAPDQPELILLDKKIADSVFLMLGTKIVYGGVEISGSVTGKAVFLFPEKDATDLSNIVAGGNKHVSEATFKEIFNIFTGNYLSALANFLDIKILHSFPITIEAKPKEITKALFSKNDELICIRTVINLEKLNLSGFFILMIDDKNLEKLLEFIHKKY